MATARFHLIRHGAVHRDWKGRIYGCRDVPLSPEGEEEARRAAERMNGTDLAAVISSGLQRTEFGAALLRAGRGLDRIDDPLLREIDRGEWVGLRFEELEERDPGAWERWQEDPARRCAPGGESLAQVSARVGARLDHWAAVHPGQEVAVVAHRWVIRTAICHTNGWSLARALEIDVGTGELWRVDWAVGE